MYDFYLDRILLPVAPSELEISIHNQNRTLTLMNEGEINILKKAGLSDISFTALIPQSRYPFAVYKDVFQPAEFFLNAFEELKVKQAPFQFIVARALPHGRTGVIFGDESVSLLLNETSLFSSNIKVSLENYIINESAENGLDIEVQISLKQYRDYGTKTEIEIVERKDGTPTVTIKENRPAENPPTAKSHTVVSGDTLWGIAKKYLNKGSRWTEIFDLNPKIEKRNLGTGRAKYTIYPGQTFMLPNL